MVNTKGFNPTTGEWNATLTGDYLWSNVNFGEAVTEVMTPLAWSVLAFTLDDWIFVPGIPSVGNIGGRPYLNISAFATVFHAMGRGRADLMRATEATLYMRLPDEMEIPLIPLSVGGRLASVANGLRVQAKQRAGVQNVNAYLAANPAWFERTRARVQPCDRDGLSGPVAGRDQTPRQARGLVCAGHCDALGELHHGSAPGADEPGRSR